jgi:hypothetical protein
MASERTNDPMDFGLGAHIHTAGRLIQDQHLRLRDQPFRQNAFCWLPPLR